MYDLIRQKLARGEPIILDGGTGTDSIDLPPGAAAAPAVVPSRAMAPRPRGRK